MEKSIHSYQYHLFLGVLRRARKRAGLTQVELAKRVGEEQSFVSKCERGERRIDIVELRAFCQAFGTSLRNFTDDLERAIAQARTRRRQVQADFKD